MPKTLEDTFTRQYKKNLEELMKIVNEKPSDEILEKLRQRYVKVREADETHTK